MLIILKSCQLFISSRFPDTADSYLGKQMLTVLTHLTCGNSNTSDINSKKSKAVQSVEITVDLKAVLFRLWCSVLFNSKTVFTEPRILL